MEKTLLVGALRVQTERADEALAIKGNDQCFVGFSILLWKYGVGESRRAILYEDGAAYSGSYATLGGNGLGYAHHSL